MTRSSKVWNEMLRKIGRQTYSGAQVLGIF